jgi:hypothetical protein
MPAEAFTRVFVTVDAFLVIFLAFAFALGNGWATALRLGINPYIAPFMQPAVDLAVIGLMVGIRYLAIHGWTDEQLKLPRRWLRFFGFLTLAMNTALPISERHYGRAAWDAIGPILLIAWSELAPWLLRAIYSVRAMQEEVVPQQAPPMEDASGEEEPQRDSGPAEPQPEAEDTTRKILAVRVGTPQEVVAQWLREWARKGRTYAENPAAALHREMAECPQAFRLTNDVGRRRLGQICAATWDEMYEKGEVKTPRPTAA